MSDPVHPHAVSSPIRRRSPARFGPAALGVLALVLAAPSTAQAATLSKACSASLLWGTASSWTGGVVPGANDIGAELGPNTGSCGIGQLITVDASAPEPLGGWIGGQLHNAGQNAGGVSLALARDTTFNGNVYIREGNFVDGGYDVTILGTLANCGNSTCAYLNGEGNGLGFTRTGGTLDVNQVYLQRSSSASFRPGDTANNFVLACLSQRNACPTPSITQDPTYYADTSDEGLTVDGTLTLGALSATVESKLTLNWNTSGFTGAVDWTLRVAGNQVSVLTTAYTNGQLVIGTLPSGVTFDPATHIFYNATDGYTYVGFVGDSDGDGVADGLDVCPGGDDTVDPDLDGVPSDCDVCPADYFNDGDEDGVCDGADLCPATYDPNQEDFDLDDIGDACDDDWDGDGVPDETDLCAGADDSDDADGDLIPDGPDRDGEVCDICPLDAENDADVDLWCESDDNCPDTANEDQDDLDGDLIGDACDADRDGDNADNEDDCAPDDPTGDATVTWFLDADGDGFGDVAAQVLVCETATDPAGYVQTSTDCDDTDAEVHPDALEVCDDDDVDDDCDGVADDDDDEVSGQGTWYVDADGDGLGDSGSPTSACDLPSGYAATGGDLCDDDAPASGLDADGDGCTDAPSVPGFSTTANADGTYTLTTGEDATEISVVLPAGTTTDATAAITQSTDEYGNRVILFSGITLPSGGTKSATLYLPASAFMRQVDYKPKGTLQLRQILGGSRHCVIDSESPSPAPTKTGCTGILWRSDTNINLTTTGQNVNTFSSIFRTHSSGLYAGKVAAGFGVPLGERTASWAGAGTVVYSFATTKSTVTLAYKGQKYTAKYYDITGARHSFYDLRHTGIVVYADDDGDGIPNADEVVEYGTDPDVADSDGDGLPDGIEVAMGTGPLDADDSADPDADGDGLAYDQELLFGTDPDSADSDGDGVGDVVELADETDALDAASSLYEDLDGNGVDDRRDDDDGDGIDAGLEAEYGTDASLADTDGDGVSDYAEVYIYETDPLDAADVLRVDSDGDGLDDDVDNCIEVDNLEQDNADGDMFGDGCDDDDDDDGADDDDETCDTDPAKTAAGDCGCGTADEDADLDGVTDCLEEVLTIDGRRSHVYFEDGLGVYAQFNGALELNGGLLAPDLRSGDAGYGQIGATIEGVAAYSNDAVTYEVADGGSAVDNRERWGWKVGNNERASVRWKDSEKYVSTRDPAFPSLDEEDNYGRLVSRFIHADETRLRFRWTRKTELPLTVAIDGVPLLTVTEDADDSCVEGETTPEGAVYTCLDGYALVSTYDVHEVYRDEDGERKRVVDIDFTGDRLGDGNVIAWYADADADDGLSGLLYSQLALDDGTGTSVWYNAGGRFEAIVPITGVAEPSVSCPSATLNLQFGDASTAAVLEGSAEWTGYDVERRSQTLTKKVNGRRVTVTRAWTHWRANEVGEDCELDDDTCDED